MTRQGKIITSTYAFKIPIKTAIRHIGVRKFEIAVNNKPIQRALNNFS